METIPPLMLSVKNVAKALGLSVATVNKFLNSGLLSTSPRTKRNRVIPYSQVIKLVNEAEKNFKPSASSKPAAKSK